MDIATVLNYIGGILMVAGGGAAIYRYFVDSGSIWYLIPGIVIVLVGIFWIVTARR